MMLQPTVLEMSPLVAEILQAAGVDVANAAPEKWKKLEHNGGSYFYFKLNVAPHGATTDEKFGWINTLHDKSSVALPRGVEDAVHTAITERSGRRLAKRAAQRRR